MTGLVRITRQEHVYVESHNATVWLTATWRDDLVYHSIDRGADWKVPLEDGWTKHFFERRTDCGYLVYRDTWENRPAPEFGYRNERSESPGTQLPLKHAVKFARPCKKCWP